MKKSIKRKKAVARSSVRPKAKPQVGPDIEGLINKLMQQFIVLERKIDALASPALSVSPALPVAQRSDTTQRPPDRKQDNGFRERILHKAVCADCNKECEVPFKPSGTRPVYCKECFAKRKNGVVVPKEKLESRPAERVVVYERSFQKDQAAAESKNVAKKTHTARRRR